MAFNFRKQPTDTTVITPPRGSAESPNYNTSNIVEVNAVTYVWTYVQYEDGGRQCCSEHVCKVRNTNAVQQRLLCTGCINVGTPRHTTAFISRVGVGVASIV